MAEITRANAAALIDEEQTAEIWQTAAAQSLAMQTFATRQMTSKTQRLDLLDVLPSSSGSAFVTGDTGRKQVLNMAWSNKVLEAEEIAGVVPIPEAVLEDASVDLWGQVTPRIAEYIARYVDAAVFLGSGAPASFPVGGIAGRAVAAGNTLDASDYAAVTAAASGTDRYAMYNALVGMVEEDGFDPRALYTRLAERRALRNIRDGEGRPVLVEDFRSADSLPNLFGADVHYDRLRALPALTATATDVVSIVGDPDYAILGYRTGIEFKLLDQATLDEDVEVMGPDGETPITIRQTVLNLAQQDCVALRFRFRFGFQIADPTTLMGGSSAFPFAVARVGDNTP